MLRRLIDSPWSYFALAALLLVAAVLSQFEYGPQERPRGDVEDVRALAERDDLNVIFIVIDMLRADRLSAYGYSRDTSPHMARLAGSGVRFAHVEAQSSWTKASMASLWTGMYPQQTGIHRFFHAMPEEALMPAEIFQEAGFRTAGIWRNGWVANNFGFGQGFDLYIRPRQVRPEHEIRRFNPSAAPYKLQGTDMDAAVSAMEFMTGVREERFFLYLHLMDVHQYLYADVSPDYGSGFSDIYDMSIYWTDYVIGRLVENLGELRIADRTLLVIVSDHGEAFFEHGQEGHARQLYREQLEVPWLIVFPFELDYPVVIQQRTANVDVWPTLLDMLGMPGLPGAQGRSFREEILAAIEAGGTLGESPDSERAIYAQLDRSWGQVHQDPKPLTSMVKGPYRFNYQNWEGVERMELFDRSTDARERKNLVELRPEVTDALRGDVQRFLEGAPTEWDSAREVELDEMRINQLRALGYVVENRPRGQGEPGEAPAADTGAEGAPQPE